LLNPSLALRESVPIISAAIAIASSTQAI
jgi:hypothetical protein